MLKSKGILSVEPHKGRIVLDVSNDFIQYYKWHICKRYWIDLNTPMHGAHVTVFNEKFHTKPNWKKALEYHGKTIEFDYDENIIEGGYTKGFIMYYIKVFSSELDDMKRKLQIIDGERYRGLHITLANSKNNSIKASWPKMITIN